MYLKIFIDSMTNCILKKEPSEEFSGRLGDEIILNNNTYSIMDISTEEFSGWELIVVEIKVSELRED